MPGFTDSQGKVWQVPITIGTAKRVKELLKVDLLQPLEGDPPLLTRIGTDLIFLCDLLFVVCKPQADQRGVTDAQFAECLAGEALQAASEALAEGLADFFRQFGRSDVTAAIQKQREVIRRAVDLAGRTIASEAFAAQIDRELARIPGSLSGDLPDLLVSIPFPSPSEN
jgi:hypothetical protein